MEDLSATHLRHMRSSCHVHLKSGHWLVLQGVAQYTKAHIVVILIHGGPLDVEWLQQSDRVGAILTAWYPGQVRARFNL